jgi:hypothetical protein
VRRSKRVISAPQRRVLSTLMAGASAGMATGRVDADQRRRARHRLAVIAGGVA